MSTILDHATSTIDDLTLALANASRGASPEPVAVLVCCCGEESCVNLKSWLDTKARLESRLTLSAEVGQALLKRHEAYVQRHESRCKIDSDAASTDDGYSTQDELDNRISELQRRNSALETRLTQAHVNNEVVEVSNKTILQELQEAKVTISRLSAHHARSVGWDNRLNAAIKEKEDMQQERDFESQRARLAESRFAALKDKTSKLQGDVRRLQDDLQEKRSHRLESSESILHEARTRIQAFHESLATPSKEAEEELTKVLESLVDETESLKRDNKELQNFLADSREQIQQLQEEVEEQRLVLKSPSRNGAISPLTPSFRQQHFYSGSMPSSVYKEQVMNRRARGSSAERQSRRNLEPLTPDSVNRPLSPTDPFIYPDWKRASLSQPHPRYPTSPYQIELEENSEQDPSSPEKPRIHKQFLLLNRSRGVQTEPEATARGLLSPSPLPSHASSASPDPRSESSSFVEASSNMTALIDRAAAFLNRMTQADAYTLTNRLKRQHLHGADVGHLSRTTISNILAEVAALRTHYRHLLEDENVITHCSRKDLRNLLKLFRDAFGEMGQMRVTLNEIVLDPSVAHTVREMTLNPKSVADVSRGGEAAASTTASGWMAPISKLFGTPARGPEGGASSALRRSASGQHAARPPRFVPKIGPALSASATTVNVEFTGSGAGRVSATQTARTTRPPVTPMAPSRSMTGTLSHSPSVMGIFAGAPTIREPPSGDSWVVVPPRPAVVTQMLIRQNNLRNGEPVPRTPVAARGNPNRLSRHVDAVIDSASPAVGGGGEEGEEEDYVAPLLQRTLRRRGLSDSSIHSTFTEGEAPSAAQAMAEVHAQPVPIPNSNASMWPDRSSVLQSLSRQVQNFRSSTLSMGTGTVANSTSSSDTGTSPPAAQHMHYNTRRERTSSQGRDQAGSGGTIRGIGKLLPDLTTWAAAAAEADQAMYAGTPRGEPGLLYRGGPGAGGRAERGFGHGKDMY